MEDILQYNFTVKSNIHDYEVHFIDDIKSTLANELKEGEINNIHNKQKTIFYIKHKSTELLHQD